MSGTKNIILKKLLRKEIAAKIKEMTQVDKHKESEIIFSKLVKHSAYVNSKRVGVYVHRDDEVHTNKIIDHIFKSGKECFIPRYNAADMFMEKLHSVDEIAALSKSRHNIPQFTSTDNREDCFKAGGLDLVIVPGRAFTQDGKRLGRGKGYYDKYFQDLKQVSPHFKTIGVGFTCQLVDDLPMSEHDVPLDYVIHPFPENKIG